MASQEAIRFWAPTAGAFSTPTLRIRTQNPTALTNLLQMLLMLSISAALTNVFGRMVGDQRQGWVIYAVMAILCFAGVATAYWAEFGGNPAFASLHIDQTASALQSGGNMEGKEVRFGIANSALFTTTTTDASCGAVNNMHDSLLPLAGMVPMINIMLGEIIFGGVGSGLYGMLLFAVLAVFIAGLMVGRTPEYLGKKIEAKEGQDDDAGHTDPAALDPRFHGDRRSGEEQGWMGSPMPVHTASARSFTLIPPRPAITAAPSRDLAPTRPSITPLWAWRCSLGGS